MRLMRIAALLVVVSQIACTQAGESSRRPQDPLGAPTCDPRTSANCPPERTTAPALKPAVPPVPESPIKVDCAKLPTQVERDTCTNRKESTG